MKLISAKAITLLLALPAGAEDFFIPNGPGAALNAKIHRLIPQAMTEGRLIQNELNVQEGFGPMVCQQGVTQSPVSGSDASGPIVLESNNVCISR